MQLQSLFPPCVHWVALPTAAGDPRALLPAERAVVATALAARAQEFAAGRQAARAALRELGVTQRAALLPRADRSADWPAGIVGSIAHCASVTIAAVARDSDLECLGCDVERIAAVVPEVWSTICSPAEWERLQAAPAERRQTDAALLFSAKEAVYKAQAPQSGPFLEFEWLTVDLSEDRARFCAILTRAVGPLAAGTSWVGRIVQADGLVATSVAVRRAGRGVSA